MQEAIREATRAKYPYGAVAVHKGKVIARAGTAATPFDPTAHAEVAVLRKAAQKLRRGKLEGVTIYTTCEPCPMCFAACWWARVSRIVYGMTLQDSSRLAGPELQISAAAMNRKGGGTIELTGKVLRAQILRLFPKK